MRRQAASSCRSSSSERRRCVSGLVSSFTPLRSEHISASTVAAAASAGLVSSCLAVTDVGGLGGGDSDDDVGSVRPRAQAEGRIGGGGHRQKLRALRRGLSVLEKAIARGRVLVYAGHYSIPSICLASAGHFFVQNCCYGGGQAGARPRLPLAREGRARPPGDVAPGGLGVGA